MRTRSLAPLLLVPVLFLLAACQPTAPDAGVETSPEATGQDEVTAPDPNAGVAMKPATFEAFSKTAGAFTGAISLTAITPSGPNDTPSMILQGANGLRYETDLIPGGAAQAAVIDWSEVFNTPINLSPDASMPDAANPMSMAPSVDIHVVTAEDAPSDAVNGGLCGDVRPFALAMAVPIDVGGGVRIMSIAAFSGEQWPPINDAALCGTFNYVLPG